MCRRNHELFRLFAPAYPQKLTGEGVWAPFHSTPWFIIIVFGPVCPSIPNDAKKGSTKVQQHIDHSQARVYGFHSCLEWLLMGKESRLDNPALRFTLFHCQNASNHLDLHPFCFVTTPEPLWTKPCHMSKNLQVKVQVDYGGSLLLLWALVGTLLSNLLPQNFSRGIKETPTPR